MLNKYIIFLLFILSVFLCNSQTSNTLTDNRDGNRYKTVRIGNQIWMAENLKYKSDFGKCYVYDNDISLANTYGYLYDWSTACKVCPSGWRLPSNEEWLTLSNYLGSNFKEKMIKESGWIADEIATNESGFSGIPAGMRDHNGNFIKRGVGAYFWTSTFAQQYFSYARELGANAGNYASHLFGTNQNIAISVRCINNDGIESSNNNYEEEEEVSNEYTESEYEEPSRNIQSSSDKEFKKEYSVFKTQTCNEQQDIYFEYTEEYKCKPYQIQNLTINVIISNDNEVSIALKKPHSSEIDEYTIESIELSETGNKIYYFTIINQPHSFEIDEKKKIITWVSEWGHWKELYFFK